MITLSEVYDRLMDIHTCEEVMCGCGIHLLLADVMGSLPPYQNDRVEELESALRLALAVAPDDPLLITEPEKEIFQLREQVRGLCESVIASAFESHVQLLHGADYEVCDNPFCKFAYALEQKHAT